jgi:RNA polymerase sigma factor (sigma-70 family)
MTANVLLRHLRTVAASQGADLNDRQLLERFAAGRDQGAFEALVRRHAPLVLGVCRRVLHHEQDAEDAFQATFLVLARKAVDVGRHGSVAGWLYRVAYHAAIRARAQSVRREDRERQAAPRESPDLLEEVSGRELLAVLDEELQRLPEDRRVPLVLCYLQGHTCDEAARQLGWSLRTLNRRLEQGRNSLRARLARRGIALPAALLTLGLTQKAKAVVPAAWVAATVQAAFVLDSATAPAPTAAAAIAEAVLRGMSGARSKALGALLLMGALILGAGAMALRAPARPPDPPPPAPPVQLARLPDPEPQPRPADPAPAREEGEAKKSALSGRVIGAYDRPLKGARVVVYATLGFGILSGRSEEKVLGEVKTDADGSFRLEAPEPAVGRYARRDVVVFAKGYGPAWQGVAANDHEPLTLQLSPERSTTGRLIDLQGAPAAGVKLRPVSVVHIWAAGRGRGIGRGGPAVRGGEYPQRRFTFHEDAAGQPAAVTTDPSGRFRLDGFAPDQQVHLLVEDDRFARQEVVVPAEQGNGDKELSVTLLPPRLFTGRIVAGDADKPVAGALVRVRVAAPPRTEGPIPTRQAAEGRTGADGRFSVNASPGDQYFIEVFPPAGEPYLGTSKSADWPRGAVKQEMNFTLARGVLVRGTVSEPGGKKPVGSAEVAVIAPGESRPRLPVSILYTLGQKHYTGTDGRFEVVAPIGTSHLVVTAPNPGYVYRTITEQELRTGKPGGDVRHFHAIVSLDFAAKDGPKEVKVELRRAVTVKGRVVGPDGKPVPSAELSVPSELAPPPEWRYLEQPPVEATRVATLMTRDDGTFALPDCDPEKPYRVFFLDAEPLSGPTGPPGNVKDRFDALNRYLGPNHLGAVAEISPAKIGDKVLEVKLARCGSAEVRFVDAKGKPVQQRFRLQLLVTPGPSLRKSREEGKPAAQAQDLAILPADLPGYDAPFRADAEGWVRIPSLIPGATYRVQAMGVRSEVLFEKDFTVESGKTAKLELTMP